MVAVVGWQLVTWWQLLVDSQLHGGSCWLTVSYMVAVVGWQLRGSSSVLVDSYMVAVVPSVDNFLVAVVRWQLHGDSCSLTVTWWQLFVDSYMVAVVRWQLHGGSCWLTVSYMVAVVGWQLRGSSSVLVDSYMVAVVGWQLRGSSSVLVDSYMVAVVPSVDNFLVAVVRWQLHGDDWSLSAPHCLATHWHVTITRWQLFFDCTPSEAILLIPWQSGSDSLLVSPTVAPSVPLLGAVNRQWVIVLIDNCLPWNSARATVNGHLSTSNSLHSVMSVYLGGNVRSLLIS